jgi:hypothetical protein
MFRVNKPSLFPKKYASHVAKYSMPCHLKFAMWKTIYQEYSMTWHGIFLKIHFYSNE